MELLYGVGPNGSFTVHIKPERFHALVYTVKPDSAHTADCVVTKHIMHRILLSPQINIAHLQNPAEVLFSVPDRVISCSGEEEIL